MLKRQTKTLDDLNKLTESGYYLPKVHPKSNINLENLIQICSKKIAQNPRHKKALYIRASSLVKKQQFATAIEDCNSLLAVETQHLNALHLRGVCRQQMGRTDLAIEDFSRVIALDAFHVNAIFSRAACYNLNGDYQKAIEDYHTALDKDQQKYRKFAKGDRVPADSQAHWQPPFLAAPSRQDDCVSADSQTNWQPPLLAAPSRQDDNLLSPKGDFVHPDGTATALRKLSFSAKKLLSFDTHKYQPQKELTDLEKASWYILLRRYHQQGYEARKKEDFALAIQLYTEGLRFNPHHFKMIFNRGFAYDKLKMYDLAVQVLHN